MSLNMEYTLYSLQDNNTRFSPPIDSFSCLAGLFMFSPFYQFLPSTKCSDSLATAGSGAVPCAGGYRSCLHARQFCQRGTDTPTNAFAEDVPQFIASTLETSLLAG